MLQKLQEYRFSILGLSLLLYYLIPSLLYPYFDQPVVMGGFLALISLCSVNLMMRSQNRLYFGVISALVPVLIFEGRSIALFEYELLLFATFTLFFSMVAYHLFTQMNRIKVFDVHVVIGSMTGYFLLGTLTFFAFCFIEKLSPGSFTVTQQAWDKHPEVGQLMELSTVEPSLFSDLYYFSFMSMTTVGYGDILPLSLWAKKGVVLTSIIGPFYLAVVVAIIVSKYLAHEQLRVNK